MYGLYINNGQLLQVGPDRQHVEWEGRKKGSMKLSEGSSGGVRDRQGTKPTGSLRDSWLGDLHEVQLMHTWKQKHRIVAQDF